METHYRKLENMYLSAPCNQVYKDLSLVISEGEATVGYRAEAHQFHAAGSLHGAHYFKALDDAAFFAANSLVPEVFVLTADLHVQLFRPVGEGWIEAKGRVTKPGKSILFAEALLYDDKGRELAKAAGAFARSEIRLDSIDVYAL